MNSKAGFYIAHGIGFSGLCLSATLLEIYNKDSSLLWLGVMLWALKFIFADYENESNVNKERLEEAVSKILTQKGIIKEDA